jgi:magnesium chelatase subunit D
MILYPFSAIVGQDKLKKALLLCAVNPGIGGVLIKGEKGTAKSTAVRGLAAVMPALEASGEPVPFVDLPLGASEDRVLGSLDIEAILSDKTKKLLPGLLASAHEGVLYIDEVNLLADHLVDVLLDVAASGVNTVQREGLSVSHPARFVLIGTMNPEEGNLRPQFLDRFGLMVEVGAQTDVQARTEVVRRRIAFEQDPVKFGVLWEYEQQLVQKKITAAKQLLPEVQMPDGLLSMISQLCIEWGVGSLRADIVLYKTAITLTALNNRRKVTADDVHEAAELVLMHRKGKKTPPPQSNNSSNGADDTPMAPRQKENALEKDQSDDCGEGNCDKSDDDEQVADINFRINVLKLEEKVPSASAALPEGKAVKAKATVKGYQIRTEKNAFATEIAINDTVIHALTRNSDRLEVGRDDLFEKVKNGKTGHLILFVVDASGSTAAGNRMEAVKGCVMSLLQDAYQKRNTVGVIAFRGVEATVLLEPTRSIELAEQALKTLPTGGRTPLPHALQLLQKVLEFKSYEANIQTFIVLLTDGKANVPLAGGDVWQQSLDLSRRIAEAGHRALVLDTESGYVRQGKAKALADALGAEYLPLDELSTDEIMDSLAGRIVI